MAGLSSGLAAAYSATGAAWQQGPARVYDRLAAALVAATPVNLAGRTVLDVGSGTGAASRAITAAGGRPVAVDLALGMLSAIPPARPPCAAADARRLPFPHASVGGLVAAFSLNHVPDPDQALREARRVVRAGGPVLASAYSADDEHPAKAAVERAASEFGWRPEPWMVDLRATSLSMLATVEDAAAVAGRAGMPDATVTKVEVAFDDLSPADLVAWRCGLAQLAPFVGGLDDAARRALVERALDVLGDAPPLRRRMITIVAVA